MGAGLRVQWRKEGRVDKGGGGGGRREGELSGRGGGVRKREGEMELSSNQILAPAF